MRARGNTQDALAMLDQMVLEGFASAREELRGDILMEQGDEAGALAAFELALAAADAPDGVSVEQARPVLRMKRDAAK